MLFKQILNPADHRTCKHFFTESSSSFLLADVEEEALVEITNPDHNNLVVILEGNLLIEYNEFIGQTFSGGEILFIPAYAKSFIKSLQKSRVLIGTFAMPQDVCTTKIMESLWKVRSTMEYSFSSLQINEPMQMYLDLLTMYLESGIQCGHLHEIKEKEIFLVFRWFYSNEDFVKLFYPIIGKELDFRATVIKNYNKVKSIGELADAVGMSRANFDSKFKEAFGIPPKRWILKRKAQSIRYFMTKPNVTISDVMIKYDFDSFTQFNRFCRQQFGKTPSELIKELKSDILNH